MNFVENNDLPGEPELAHEEMIRGNDAQQRLVNRVHPDRYEECSFGRRKPRTTYTYVRLRLSIRTGGVQLQRWRIHQPRTAMR